MRIPKPFVSIGGQKTYLAPPKTTGSAVSAEPDLLTDYNPGVDRYDETPGGHADRHTLVLEAAENALAVSQ